MRAMVTIAALLLWSALTGAQVEIRSLTGTLGGHEVGGVTIDMIGKVYAADFGDIVWKLIPEGQRTTSSGARSRPADGRSLCNQLQRQLDLEGSARRQRAMAARGRQRRR